MMKTETRQALAEAVVILDNVGEDINWMKIRIGLAEYWIVSKEKPNQDRVASVFPVQIDGELAGWWLWTY